MTISRLIALVACLTAAVPALTGSARAESRALVLLESRSDPEQARSAARAVIARNRLQRARADVDEIGLVTVRLRRGETAAGLAKRLHGEPEVVSVQPELRRELRYVPNDPALHRPDASGGGLPYQWNMLRQGLPDAWDQARGDGVKVGIIDTGIDSTHPDLGPKIVAAVDQDRQSTGTADEVGHGTHVAGLACGAGDNSFGIVGAGFNCQLVIEKTDLSSSSIVASIVDATKRGARVINMSFGGRGITLAERRALRYAVDRDVVLIAAAADAPEVNQGHPAADLQPATTGPKIEEGFGLVVTAADLAGKRAFFSGRGSQISLAAYGYTANNGAPGMFSSYPANETQFDTGATQPPSRPCQCRAGFDGSNSFGYLFGTSMAAPQVAGIAALVRSAAPGLPASSVIRILKETANQSRWNTELGWGLVDAGAAVRLARAYAADTVAPASTARGRASRTSGRQIKLRWSGRDLAPAGVRPSGIARYRLLIRRGGKYVSLGTTRKTSQRLRGKPGRSYSFAVQASDRAGNREALPDAADFSIRVRR